MPSTWKNGMLNYWPPAPLPARRAYRPEGSAYGSESILIVRTKINYLNCQKLLQTHYSIIPLLHYSNWGEGPPFL